MYYFQNRQDKNFPVNLREERYFGFKKYVEEIYKTMRKMGKSKLFQIRSFLLLDLVKILDKESIVSHFFHSNFIFPTIFCSLLHGGVSLVGIDRFEK